jgi:uncharacterized membrane protein YfhO
MLYQDALLIDYSRLHIEITCSNKKRKYQSNCGTQSKFQLVSSKSREQFKPKSLRKKNPAMLITQPHIYHLSLIVECVYGLRKCPT